MIELDKSNLCKETNCGTPSVNLLSYLSFIHFYNLFSKLWVLSVLKICRQKKLFENKIASNFIYLASLRNDELVIVPCQLMFQLGKLVDFFLFEIALIQSGGNLSDVFHPLFHCIIEPFQFAVDPIAEHSFKNIASVILLCILTNYADCLETLDTNLSVATGNVITYENEKLFVI